MESKKYGKLNTSIKTRFKLMEEGDTKSLDAVAHVIMNGDPYVSKFIWGPPGIGKSTMVKELAEKLNIGFIDVRASQLEAFDLRGYPSKSEDDKNAEWLPYKGLLPDRKIHGERGILFLDELNLASPDVMKACYQLINDRRVGSHEVEPGWVVVGAGNDIKDVPELVTEMPKTLANRFTHHEVSPPKTKQQLASMFRWFYSHGVHPTIISFLKKFPKYIYDSEAYDKYQSKSWPSPRSWFFASQEIKADLLDEHGNLLDEPEWLKYHVAAAVGQAAAMDFVSYVKIFEQIPDPQTILTDGLQEAIKKSGCDMPKVTDPQGADKLYAICNSVVYYLQSMHSDPKVIANFFGYLKAIGDAKNGNEEYAMLTIQEATRGDFGKPSGVAESIIKHPMFRDFSTQFQSLII